MLGSHPGLSRIMELCHCLDDPQEHLRCIHVAGTNGKGSTCRMLSGILQNAGYRTGLYTSPYVLKFEERICFDNSPILPEELADVMTRVRQAADKMEDPPTAFEVITAAAFLYFYEKRCDVVVLETGLGGRLDATNAISGCVAAVITGIDLDHTALLGDTTEKIAAEKAGIIKPGCPVVCGEMKEGAKEVIAQIAREKEAPFYSVSYTDVTPLCYSMSGTDLIYHGKTYHLGLLGEYQLKNFCCVMETVEVLKNAGYPISDDAIQRGVESAYWPARFECLNEDPPVFYDGGHNPQGVTAALQTATRLFRQKPILLSGVMADKDYPAMVKILRGNIRRAYTVQPGNPRSLQAERYAAEFEKAGVPAVPYSDFKQGVSAALAAAQDEKVPLLALGTLYMYADFRQALEAWKNDRHSSR